MSPNTGYLLSAFTLRISDKTIAANMNKRKYTYFNRIRWFCLIFNIISLFQHVGLYFMGTGPLFMVIVAVNSFVNQMIIIFGACKFPSKTPRFTFTYLLNHVVFVGLFFNGYLGDWEDKDNYKQQIVINFVLVNCVQFNDISFTLFPMVPTFLIGIFVQSYGECSFFAEDRQQTCSAYITANMNRSIQIALAITCSHYF